MVQIFNSMIGLRKQRQMKSYLCKFTWQENILKIEVGSYFTPVPQICRMEEGDSMVVTCIKSERMKKE